MDLCITADNPPPEGARAITVTTSDGVTLRAMLAPAQAPRGTLVLMGGQGDFLERYFETARDFAAQGYTIVAFDFRGQGGSQRPLSDPYRCHVKSFRDYEEDLRSVMAQIVLKECPAPHYAIAHSTGGAVLLGALVKHGWFTRAAVTAPLTGIVYGAWPKPVAGLLVFLATTLGLGWVFLPGQRKRPLARSDFKGNDLHGDERRWNRDSGVLEACPALGTGGPTFAWLRAARRATARLRLLPSGTTLQCPVLMVVAGRDKVVDNAASHRLARRIQGISLIEIPEARHEILSGPDAVRNQFLAAFRAFISSDEET